MDVSTDADFVRIVDGKISPSRVTCARAHHKGEPLKKIPIIAGMALCGAIGFNLNTKPVHAQGYSIVWADEIKRPDARQAINDYIHNNCEAEASPSAKTWEEFRKYGGRSIMVCLK